MGDLNLFGSTSAGRQAASINSTCCWCCRLYLCTYAFSEQVKRGRNPTFRNKIPRSYFLPNATDAPVARIMKAPLLGRNDDRRMHV